ncbi:MAG: cytochrome c [Chlamydiota bacterium]|nr:cytochrome c [Chlamydiota bacterium]
MKIIVGMFVMVLAFSFYLCADDAADIYAKKCKSCHGADGAGNAGLAKMLKVEPELLVLANNQKSDEELTAIIKDGKGKMPPFNGKLSEEEIKGLVDLSRGFGK